MANFSIQFKYALIFAPARSLVCKMLLLDDLMYQFDNGANGSGGGWEGKGRDLPGPI